VVVQAHATAAAAAAAAGWALVGGVSVSSLPRIRAQGVR